MTERGQRRDVGGGDRRRKPNPKTKGEKRSETSSYGTGALGQTQKNGGIAQVNQAEWRAAQRGESSPR